MRFPMRFALLFVAFALSLPAVQAAKKQELVLEVGQRWSYVTRDGDEESTLVIAGLSEKHKVYFLNLHDIVVHGEPAVLNFIPVTKKALRKSVTELVGEVENPPFNQSSLDRWSGMADEGTRIAIEKDLRTGLPEWIARFPAPDSGSAGSSGSSSIGESEDYKAYTKQLNQVNEALALYADEKLDEALALLDGVLANCVKPEACEAWARDAEKIRETRRKKEIRRRFNEAAELANAGDREAAIEILRGLEQEELDEFMTERVRATLEQLSKTSEPAD
ncbi:MAG: hypothetical protein GY716_17820 [bacterium]|nr:hypothetical protein [bacterium]